MMHLDTWTITGSGFHFGRHGIGQEETAVTMHSDSLFAALVARLAVQSSPAAVQAFMQPFLDGSPPFVLSSTFPFASEVRFFPAPARRAAAPSGTSAARYKELKKVEFVSEELFRALLGGSSLAMLYPQAVPLQKGAVWVTNAELTRLPKAVAASGAKLWEIEQRPRVTLGRSVQKSAIYFTGRVSFAVGCGLWFGIRWFAQDGALQQQVTALLKELADSGLGGERSVGFGACKILPAGELDFSEADTSLWVNLSRYLPRPDELDALMHPAASYRLERVGGWLDSPVLRGQRRKMVHLLAEGSVLGQVVRAAPGQVADVQPRYPQAGDALGHPVYRSGLALAVGMKGEPA